MRDLLNRIIAGESLSIPEAEDLMRRMMDEELTPIQLGAFLVALRSKGETADEVVGFARTMRSRARQIEVHVPLADTCGTGGDGRGTFNISTAAALIVTGCGQAIAKHGNRSISSKCGSADVVEALGINIQLSPERAAQCLRDVGICFLYAPNLHPAMKQVQTVRRELRMRTMFNLLGPLTNPARASGQVVGVYSLDLVEKLAEALSMLGLHRALVVHGLDGLELGLSPIMCGATQVAVRQHTGEEDLGPIGGPSRRTCPDRCADARYERVPPENHAEGNFLTTPVN